MEIIFLLYRFEAEVVLAMTMFSMFLQSPYLSIPYFYSFVNRGKGFCLDRETVAQIVVM